MNLLPRGRQAPRRALAIVRVVFGFLVVAATVFAASTSAQAEAPINISGPVSDLAGAVDDPAAVEAALKAYADETGYQLFVVYVPTFDGMDGAEWADRTADLSNIGPADLLLAVATQERSYGISVADENPYSDSDIATVERDRILPELRNGNWGGAAIAAAEGLTDVAQQAAEGDGADGSENTGESGSSGAPWGWILGGAAALGVGGGAYALARPRRRRGNDGLPTLEELDAQRGSALVSLDDAVRSSQQELAFAEAQFGKEATKQFSAALGQSQSLARQAFEIQQRLDDAEPEAQTEHRAMAEQILHLCEQAENLLTEQVDAFNALRDLQARAPEVLADMAARADEVIARLPAARATLEVLAATYPTTDLASVTGNADQAEQLVAHAREQCEQGRQAVAADDRATAVVRAKAAEAAIAQSTTLLDAIARADADLKAAPAQITESIGTLSQDIADAERLAPDDALVTTSVSTAREALSRAQTPGHDPLATLAALEQAEAHLDELLAPARAAAEEAEKARIALQRTIDRVTARAAAVSDYLDTRRGAIGLEPRTRLSEGQRFLDLARSQVSTDPAAALDSANRAGELINSADQLARHEVDRWERRQRQSNDSTFGGGGSSGGWWSGGSSSSSRRSSSSRSSSRRSSSRRSSSRRSSSRSSRRSSGGGSRGKRSRGGRF